MKTEAQIKAEFATLMNRHGFTPNGETNSYGEPVYSRTWSKETEVLWYGKSESRMEIKVSEAFGIPGLRIFRNGRPDGKMRNYTTPKRAINAMREIVTFAGYEF